jgi:glycosyltransferase involved in cell wall biosynthesis
VKISVVIPAKDDAEMLQRCLESLQRQNRSPDEVIVVDNASADDTAEVARRFGTRLLSEQRPGITAAASAGYDAATGDVIARCDADSVLPPDWLHRIEWMLREHPEAVAITGRGRFYDLGPLARVAADVFYMRAYFAAAGGALARVPLFGSNFAMRADAWREVSPTVPRDEVDLHDDFDLSYRLDPAMKVLYDRELVVGISGRPFSDIRAMGKRVRRAKVTVAEHLPEQSPVRRWRRRATTRRVP